MKFQLNSWTAVALWTVAVLMGACIWAPTVSAEAAAWQMEPAWAQSAAPAPELPVKDGLVQVGEEVVQRLTSPSFAGGTAVPGLAAQERLVWSHNVTSSGATYIAPHFSYFNLPEGARLVVRAPDNSRSWEFTGTGKGKLGLDEGFWGTHIPGDTAILELFSDRPVKAGAVVMDRYAQGYPGAFDPPGGQEALCGPDDSLEAKCYQASQPAAYSKARAVARLLINGTGACTGWLVGNAGHLMTNQHCIGNNATAMNTDYEFMAEGATCPTSCTSWFGCPGSVVANSATLVAVSAPLDYALVQLPTNPSSTYGFLKMRTGTGTAAGERIYIPQHPQAWGKRIALESTHPGDTTGFCQVESVDRPACTGAPVDDIGYWCDTQGGSSGSPVLARCDNAVVALHHCRGAVINCGTPNRGVPIQAIIDDIGADQLPPNSTVRGGCSDCGPGYCNKAREYCDDLGCYPVDSPQSILFCQCRLQDPACGLGFCIGNNWCTGFNCPLGVCYIDTAPQSQVMCQGFNIDPETCQVSE